MGKRKLVKQSSKKAAASSAPPERTPSPAPSPPPEDNSPHPSPASSATPPPEPTRPRAKRRATAPASPVQKGLALSAAGSSAAPATLLPAFEQLLTTVTRGLEERLAPRLDDIYERITAIEHVLRNMDR